MLHCPSVIVLIICLISCLYTTQVYGYIRYTHIYVNHQLTVNNDKMINRRTTSQLYLFGNKASSKVVIKVDGKTITSDEKTVNLRKELMKNNVDVYPLRAKITGNNNYD